MRGLHQNPPATGNSTMNCNQSLTYEFKFVSKHSFSITLLDLEKEQ